MNKEISKVMHKYTDGKIDLTEANKQLAAQKASFHLDPEKNTISEAEMLETTVGYYPSQANGWGLLDTGTGSLDKVRVTKGMLDNVDCGEMPALLWIAGKCYHIDGRACA